MSAIEILRELSLFADLSAETLQAVASRTVTRTLARGTVVFRSGEPCKGLYVVVEGAVRVYRASGDGREQVLHVQGAGQPFGEAPLFDAGPYFTSARAIRKSRVLFLPIDEFQRLYRSHPEIADSIIRDLGRRLRLTVSLVETISLRSVPARVATALLEYAERAGALPEGLAYTLPRTQEELADELGTTREGIARVLSRLRREGIIAQHGSRVQILSPVRLREIAQPHTSGAR